MSRLFLKLEGDLNSKLNWLMFFRILFAVLLLGSTIVLHISESPSAFAPPLLFLYGLIIGIFCLSFTYALILRHTVSRHRFAYLQVGFDTFVVTLIIFVTGGYSSIFIFLYLVVIIYSSILIFRRGSLTVAAFCSLQYILMVWLEYSGVITPVIHDEGLLAVNSPLSDVVYKIIITIAACYAVAFLSSLLSEQNRNTKRKLSLLEDRVKRVEKLAAVGEMAAGLAHEIKNPLASLTGSIQLLKEDIRCNPQNEKLMQIVLREADRLSSLLNDFLLFAKPPAGKSESIELSGALTETIDLFQKDSICSKKIKISKKFLSDVWVDMDPVHLRQILWNLLLNAAEAIENHGKIDIQMYPAEDMQVVMKITDNGCGIAKENLKSICDPFFTTKPNGTGLGLSIVYSIIESYNGLLEIESTVGEGTIIIVTLQKASRPKIIKS